jgi:hypothetical protein
MLPLFGPSGRVESHWMPDQVRHDAVSSFRARAPHANWNPAALTQLCSKENPH